MDEQDRRLAEAAEYAALEQGESDRPRRWRNPDNGRYGDVVPGRPYKRGAVDCRDTRTRSYIDGRPQTMRRTPAAIRTAAGGMSRNRRRGFQCRLTRRGFNVAYGDRGAISPDRCLLTLTPKGAQKTSAPPARLVSLPTAPYATSGVDGAMVLFVSFAILAAAVTWAVTAAFGAGRRRACILIPELAVFRPLLTIETARRGLIGGAEAEALASRWRAD